MVEFHRSQAKPPKSAWTEDAARTLSIAPGSMTRWTIAGKEFAARVACLYRIDSVHLASRVEFIFSPGALDGFPLMYYASLRAQPAAVPALEEALYRCFPTVSVINMADVLADHCRAWWTNRRGGPIHLAVCDSSGRGDLIFERSGNTFPPHARSRDPENAGCDALAREPNFFGRVSGSRRGGRSDGHAAGQWIREPAAQALAGCGGLLAACAKSLAVAATALIANAAGWMASFRILGQKPLEILREE